MNDSVEVEPETERLILENHIVGNDFRKSLMDDVRIGLSLPQKELSPKYFYDERGSNLFEEICDLPEYYQTRTEQRILEKIAPEITTRYSPSSLVEFGSGSSSKTRTLLNAMHSAGILREYVPIDVSGEMLRNSATSLLQDYSALTIRGIIDDFTNGLPMLTQHPALIIFLGSTIGNFREEQAVEFLSRISSGMEADDIFLLGLDLIKDIDCLNAAYNDSEGVTRQFNLNVLKVINRELGGHFDESAFGHYAFYNPGEHQIEMHLASMGNQTVRIDALDCDMHFFHGETILTEISRKFTRESATSLLQRSGFKLEEWYTDENELFATIVAKRS